MYQAPRPINTPAFLGSSDLTVSTLDYQCAIRIPLIQFVKNSHDGRGTWKIIIQFLTAPSEALWQMCQWDGSINTFPD